MSKIDFENVEEFVRSEMEEDEIGSMADLRECVENGDDLFDFQVSYMDEDDEYIAFTEKTINGVEVDVIFWRGNPDISSVDDIVNELRQIVDQYNAIWGD